LVTVVTKSFLSAPGFPNDTPITMWRQQDITRYE
jgi:hypothetical protein